MTSFDILRGFISIIPDEPALWAILSVLLGGLIYILGKIRVSNYWQYHFTGDDKYLPMFNGLVVLNNLVFIPILLILFVRQLFVDRSFFMSWGGGLLILLFLFEYILGRITKHIIQKTSEHPKTPVIEHIHSPDISSISSEPTIWERVLTYLKVRVTLKVMPISLYLLGYFVLTQSTGAGILIIVLIIGLFAIIRLAYVETAMEAAKMVDIDLKGKKQPRLECVRIVEFLNDGSLCKIQTARSVIVIRTDDIERISSR